MSKPPTQNELSLCLARLIVKYFRQFGEITREEAEALLGDDLGGSPTADQKEARIKNLFLRMKKAGHLKARRRGPKTPWKLGDNPGSDL